MPDDLYDRDTLARSEHEPNLLRRVARGERVNEVDWEHVIEEIEDVGLSQRNAVQSYAECRPLAQGPLFAREPVDRSLAR